MASTFRVATLETAFTADTSGIDTALKSVRGETDSFDGTRTEAEIVADATEALREIDDVRDELDEVARLETVPEVDADTDPALDQLRDLSDQLDEINDSENEPRIDPDVRDAERSIEDVHDALTDVDDLEVSPEIDADTRNARRALDDFSGEAASSGREAAASFSGEVDDIGDFLQESLVGLSAAGGPVAFAAGVAGGALAGFFINDFMENAEELEELTGEIFDAISEDGAASFSQMSEDARRAFIETRAEALLAEHSVDDIAGAAEALGVQADVVLAAMAGDTEALTEVSDAYEDKVRGIGDQWGYSSEVGTGKIRALDDATRVLSDETGRLDTATRQANARQDLLGQTMGEVTGKAEVEEQAARDLAAEINDIPDYAYTDVEVRTGGAFAAIESLNRTLNTIDGRTATAYVTAERYGQAAFADGGYTGDGGKYDVAGVVHRGEFVVDAEATSRHRALLEAINAGMPGYADGGYASPGSVATAPTVNVAAPSLPSTVVLEIDGRTVTGVMREVAQGELASAARSAANSRQTAGRRY